MKSDRVRRRTSAAFVHGLTRVATHLQRAQDNLVRFSEAFAAAAVDRQDLTEITIRQYDRRPPGTFHGLFAWERVWLVRDLPPPPAKLLVGGCGTGREVHELVALGYSVYAFEPAHDCAEVCRRDVPGAACIAELAYEDLGAAPAQRKPEAHALHMAAPFDAVLLGWGSLAHVLDEREQDKLFAVLAQLAPRGPILTTYLAAGTAQSGGRAAVLGYTLAKWIGLDHTASIPPHSWQAPPLRERVVCVPHLGFAYLCDRARLTRLAQIAGRRLVLHESDQCPHATLVI
jgi:hypothetical protein